MANENEANYFDQENNKPFAEGEVQLYFNSNNFRASERNRWACYTIGFADCQGKNYEWIPEWRTIQQIYTCAAVTEIMNEGTLKEVLQFAHNAVGVIQAIIEEVTRRLTNINLSKDRVSTVSELIKTLHS